MPIVQHSEHLLYTAEQSRQCDNNAIVGGIAGFELMQRAGLAAFKLIQSSWAQAPLYIFAAGGNNGGDGLVIATLAQEQGLAVTVYFLARPEKLKNEALLAYQKALTVGVKVVDCHVSLAPEVTQALHESNGVIVDALLGTGIQQAPRALMAEAIMLINSSALPVLAIDVPSGLNSDSGITTGAAIKANKTISFITRKRGVYTGSGPQLAAERVFDSLRVPAEAYLDQAQEVVGLLALPLLLDQLLPRDKAAHKGCFGHVAVIGGNEGMAGAALLAAGAAARTGSGLITLASRETTLAAMLTLQPEVMGLALTSAQQLQVILKKVSVIALGPGLGQDVWAQELLTQVSQSHLPQVLDADALNLLALQRQAGLAVYNTHRVLTPHPAEAARLLGITTAEVQLDRFQAVKQLQQLYGGMIVLKGVGSLLCWDQYSFGLHLGVAESDSSARISLCPYGNPGMASGGMGDVLTGVIASLLAQSESTNAEDNVRAVCLAVCLHAKAADILAETYGERGLLAGDLAAQIRLLLNNKVGS